MRVQHHAPLGLLLILPVLLPVTTTSVVVNAAVAKEANNIDWIDPDSPPQAYTIPALVPGDHRDYHLVFSDEFDQDGRTFEDGADPRWTALHKNDVTNNPLHYYSHDAVRTATGRLDITADLHVQTFEEYDPVHRVRVNTTKEVRSGMLQSWNKFCFTGGIVEFSVQLPGNPYTGGLWPAVWMMGNLARATYVNSTEKIWPFSTAANVCDGRNVDSQEISACNADRGRGAPEIDVLEVMYVSQINASILSSSLQVAPGLAKGRPLPGEAPNVSLVCKVIPSTIMLQMSIVSHCVSSRLRPTYRRHGTNQNWATARP